MTTTRETLRLFAAIELPDHWRTELEHLQQRQERASPGYFRWVAPPLFHLTVLFMGSQPLSRLSDIEAALRGAGSLVPPFRLSLGRVGVFGPPWAPRVLWVEAMQPDGRLQQLRQALADGLRIAEAAFDDKPLRPHITLGRSRREASGAARLVDADLTTTAHLVSEIVLFESQLSSSGPKYRKLAAVDLARDQAPARSEPRP